MLAALRYRWANSLVVMVLSALVSTCLVLAPLYTRALEQATTRTLLAEARPQDSGLSLTSTSSTTPTVVLTPDALTQLVPPTTRAFYGAPVASSSVAVRRMPLLGQPGGRLLTRDGVCQQVRFTSGRCPSSPRDVAVSADQSRAYAMPVGTSLEVGEFDAAVSLPEAAPRTTLRVVGVYEPLPVASAFGDRLTGQAAQRLGYDAMLTPVDTITGDVVGADGRATPWFQPLNAVDLPLLTGQVGVDQIGPLGSSLRELVAHPLGAERDETQVARTVTARSGLPALADEVALGSAQASVTVPLLMAQIALLLGCVLWLVLVAAADQRRGEVAVARLRGRGARGSRRLLLAETLPAVVLGAPLGALLAVAGCTLARHTVLTSDPPFELPAGAVVALGVALALMTGLTALSVRRVSREPVAALLRSVPPRRSGFRLGVLEAMLVAAALAAFFALVTGSVGGAVGQIAPTLLALAVGVVAARVLASALAVGGRMLLRRGRPAAGVALLTSSRRTTTRWLVPVVTVALAIAVVSADVLAVGARSWSGRADAEVGAASVLTLDSVDLPTVTTALHEIDPTGAHVTPVAVLSPTQDGGTTTIGVVPDAFRRIARWPGVTASSVPLERLTAPTVPPLVVTGSRIAYHVDASALRLTPPVLRAAPDALVVGLRVVRADGTVASLGLGALPADGVTADQVATVPCADGCRLTGIGVLTPRGSASVTGRLTLTRLTVDGRPVDLGAAGSWRDTSANGASVRGTFAGSFTGSPADGSLRIDYATNGFDSSFLAHASVPDVVPALTTRAASPSSSGTTFAGSYVDGSSLLLSSRGQVTFVPGGPASASLVGLDNLLAQGWRGRGSAVLEAYVDTGDAGFLARLRSDLGTHGISVASTRTSDAVAAAYGRSAAAWSLQLALAVGVLALLVAAVGVVVLASTSGRDRSRDYAALRLVGQRPRGVALLAQLETAPVIITSAVLGAVVGLWSAPVAVGLVPLFTTAPTTFPVDLSTAWGPALLAAVVGLAGLGGVGVVTSHRAARQSDPGTLRGDG